MICESMFFADGDTLRCKLEKGHESFHENGNWEWWDEAVTDRHELPPVPSATVTLHNSQAEQPSANLKCGCQPIHSTECVFRDVRSYSYRGFNAFEQPGSPRKVGEDGLRELTDYEQDQRRQCGISYGQPAQEVPRSSSVPVGEQKQEEGV